MATAKAITVAFEMATPGDTEREIARDMMDLTVEYGADQVEDPALPAYFIGIVAEVTGTHPQTLRNYERMGLLRPERSQGDVRMYSRRDVDLVRRIRRLTQDLGVNLAGVDVILQLTERMARLQKRHDEEIRELTRRHNSEVRRLKALLRRVAG